jgi:hypothetical protein
MSADPLVVIIDDQLSKVQALADDLRSHHLVETIEPWHLTDAILRDGTVFVIDLFFKDWPGRDRLSPSAQVFDGIALAAMIRANARANGRRTPIVALNTGHAEEFSELPREIREHAIARAHDLEWVFLKNDSASSVPTHERIFALLDAQRRLPSRWRADAGEQQLLEVLSADVGELSEILDSWPPIREVGEDSAGIALLRWLLHRILPYPTFLLDSRYIAARLGITCDSLQRLAAADGDLAGELARCRYAGILADFDGPRWWRSRLEQMLWTVAPSGSSLPAGAADLQAHSPIELERSTCQNGVVVLSADYTAHDQPVSVAKAVRIRLDDWPPYAEQPWATIAEAMKDHGLRERVLPLDRPRLEEPSA